MSVSSSSASPPDHSRLLEAYRQDPKISPFMPLEDLPLSLEERVRRTFNSISLGIKPLPVLEEPFKQMSAAELSLSALHSHIQELENRNLVTCWNAITRYIRHYKLCEKTPAPKGSPAEQAAVIRNWMETNQPILAQIEDLDISRCGLYTFPREICHLTHLQRLTAYSNFIASLPSQIGNFKKMLHFDVGNNCLKQLPDELWDLEKLTTLALYNNQLNSVSSKIGQLIDLEWLSLANNRLSHLPEELCKLPKLINLWLGNNPLETLPPLKHLEGISLAGNRLREISPEIYQLMARQNRLHELPDHLQGKRKMEAQEEERPSKSSKSSQGQIFSRMEKEEPSGCHQIFPCKGMPTS